jgi:hypothetical protein
MRFLTQKNALIILALQIAWGVYLSSGVLPHAHWVDVVTATFNAAAGALAFLGFTRTPAGNRLPPDVITDVDRNATLSKAQDAVVDRVAQEIVHNAEDTK